MNDLICPICHSIVEPLPYGGGCFNCLCKECRKDFENYNLWAAVKGAEKAWKTIEQKGAKL